MTTIRCDSHQPETYFFTDPQTEESWVYIRLNERVEEDENGVVYVYDYNEFHGKGLPLDDIEAHPERYLDYKVPETMSQLDRIEGLLLNLVQSLT